MTIKENNKVNTICYCIIKIQSKEGFCKSSYHCLGKNTYYYYSNFYMMNGWLMCYLTIAFFDAVIEEEKKYQNKWDGYSSTFLKTKYFLYSLECVLLKKILS